MPDQNVTIGNLRIISRADALDAEQVKEGAQGRFWELITDKVRAMIAQHVDTLKNSDDDRKLARAQGAVQSLERVLQLPAILRNEAAERSTRK